MDEKKTVDDLDQVLNEQTFAAGDAWLRNHGVIASIAHNAIVANLYVNFPKVRYLEYFLPEDSARKRVWVRLYVPFWKLLFLNRDKMMDDVIDFLRSYLANYDVKVELKRYKKGVEKSDEVPETAINHVAGDLLSDVPVPLKPTEEQLPVQPESGPGVPSSPAAGGDDQLVDSQAPAKPVGEES